MKNIKEHLIDESNISSEYYETKYNFLLKEYNKHIDKKPNKIFKKKLCKWQEEKIQLEKELKNLYEILLKSYEEIEKNIK